MKNKRWILKISFTGSVDWDIIEEYSNFVKCVKDAEDLNDNTVKSIQIKDKVTGRIVFINLT